MAEVHMPQRRTDNLASTRLTGLHCSTAVPSHEVVAGLNDLEMRVMLPHIQGWQGDDGVMGDIQRLQQRELEELCGQRRELVVGEVHVCEESCVHALLLQEDRREDGEGDVGPHQVERPGHLNGGPSVLHCQHILFIIAQQIGLLPVQGIVELVQFHVLEAGHFTQRALTCSGEQAWHYRDRSHVSRMWLMACGCG